MPRISPWSLASILAVSIALVSAAGLRAGAREQSDAPDVDVVGFSPDGRYFAYEQYGWDAVSDVVHAAVFVIDRETNQLVPDFPIGLLPEEREGVFPAPVGGFDPDPALVDTSEGVPDILALRNAVRSEAEVRLNALEIGLGARRLAGIPLTQRKPTAEADHPISFALAPTLPGPIPDQQVSYTIEADAPTDPDSCPNEMPKARSVTTSFHLTATIAWPELKPVGTNTSSALWTAPADHCLMGTWITDIYAPPAYAEGEMSVVVMFLTSFWGSFTEAGVWNASFVRLPEQPAP